MAINDFDTIFDHIGGFGRYQMCLFAVICYMSAMLAFVYFGQIFMSLTPPHWCSPPPGMDETHLGLSPDEIKRLTIPIDPDTSEFSRCQMYDVDVRTIMQSNTTGLDPSSMWNVTSCTHGWTYDFSIYYPTITTELNWVCNDDWKPAFSQSLFFIGSFIGLPILGWAADKWGRLPVIVVTNVACGLFGIASAFARSFLVFTILRFIVGLTYDTHYTVVYILVMEYVSCEYRTVMGNVPIMLFLTAAMCALPWMAYFLRNWTLYAIAIHVPQVFCLVFIWILPESARWLISQGRLDDTLKIIRKASQVNKKVLSREFIEEFKEYVKEQSSQQQSNAGVLDLLKTPNLRIRFILLSIMWMTIILAYDGHMRNTENIGLNVFVSFTVLGAVELPADFLTIIAIEWVGRRHTTVWTLILSGVCCLIISTIPEAKTTVIFGLAIAGRFLITMSINVGQQYVVEVLPTVARSSGAGAIHTLGSAVSFLSPYIVYLSKFGHFLPYLIMGIVTVIGGSFCALLPETMNEKLPDSLQDGETYFEGQACCYNPCSASKLTLVNKRGKQ
ncbi:organic cation/carnitine transporter 2-like isoform X2 [Palaemon carinicauda]|uniref:organic cation/carnitine transporter 2-like isoform X2 n=1 Tax=Palaemon carinicauda TaxID=392227 RepID=UPI0035B6A2A0